MRQHPSAAAFSLAAAEGLSLWSFLFPQLRYNHKNRGNDSDIMGLFKKEDGTYRISIVILFAAALPFFYVGVSRIARIIIEYLHRGEPRPRRSAAFYSEACGVFLKLYPSAFSPRRSFELNNLHPPVGPRFGALPSL